MYFKGTVIITDPCYLDNGLDEDLFEKSGYGEDMSVFGCGNYLIDNTIYGDWSCTTFRTFKSDPKEALKEASKYMTFNGAIGKFCSDTGMFCVVLLDDILKINPKIERWIIEHPRCVTVLPNWDGEIDYFENEDSGSISIIGTHKNSYFNFFTLQTGL